MMRSLPVVTALALGVAAAPLQAQRERYAPLVLQLPAGARSLALGGGMTASRDAESVFGNPSLVGSQTTTSVTVARYHEAAKAGALAMTTTVGMLGIGVGVQMLDYGTDVGIEGTPGGFPPSSSVLARRGFFSSSSLAATMAASLGWKGMRWGGAAKYVEERTLSTRSAVAALDLGVAKDFNFGAMSLGLMVQNIGPSLEVNGIDAPLPTRATLGVAGGGYAVGKWIDLGGSLNVSVLRNGYVAPTAGFEVAYVPIEGVSFAARTGVRRPELRELRPLTLGIGAGLDRLTLDYAWEQLRTRGGAHRLTLRLR